MANLDALDSGFRKKIEEELLPNLERVTRTRWCICQAKRSLAEQHKLFIQPKDGIDNNGDGIVDGPGEKVTNADAGQSPHNFGFAVDLCPMNGNKLWWDCPDRLWEMLATMAEGMGLVSGRRFKTIRDNPHVEDPQWKLAQSEWVANGRPVV